MATTSDGDPVLAVGDVTDLGGRVETVIHVADPDSMRTRAFPGLSDLLLTRLPGLRRHRCESGSAHGIVAELSDTELPHVVEHVALELMVLAGAPRSLRGQTTWDFRADGKGVFRVAVAYSDAETGFSDIELARRSVREAVTLVEDLSTQCRRDL